ncbi:MAG: tyrosine-type recombinase/integrase [Sedimentisphaerales bacterium]
MRIFRTTYRARNGQTKRVKKWYIELRDNLGAIRRFPALMDKQQSAALGRQIERLVSCRVTGESPTPELSRWIEGIPRKLCNRLIRIGLLDAARAGGKKPLSEHLTDFEQYLLAKGDTSKHTKQTVSRARRIITDCGFTHWTDIVASKVQQFLSGLRDNSENISAQTFNYYLQAIKEFCRWMVSDRRASESPVQYLQGLNVQTDRRHDRRALTVDEIRRLLDITATEPFRFGMFGSERSMLYRLAIETGLRANELRTLTIASLNFVDHTITITAIYSKHRRQDTIPLRSDTVVELQAFIHGKLPNARVFSVPDKPVKMFRADLQAANIAYVDESGRYADFHALRHTTGSLLAAAGVHPKVAQAIMRHSKVDLTLNRYSHVYAGQTSEAIKSLPDLSRSVKAAVTA